MKMAVDTTLTYNFLLCAGGEVSAENTEWPA